MNAVNEGIETVSKVNGVVNKIYLHLSYNLPTRMLAYILSISIIPILYILYMMFLMAEIEDDRELTNYKSNITTRILFINNTIKAIDLCLKYKESKELLAEYYCSDAISSYIRLSKGWPSERRRILIEMNGVEAMKLDAEYYLSVREDSLLNASLNTKEEKLLSYLLTTWFLLLLIFLIFITAIFSAYKLSKYSKNDG